MVFIVGWGDGRVRLDPNYHRLWKTLAEKMRKCPFPIGRLRDFIAFIQYGISERATSENIGVPMLRMLNLQNGEWDVSDLKYIELDESAKDFYRVHHGDILFNRTNSKELVGKCNVFDLVGEYVYASYLIRVRLDTLRLNPYFMVAFLSLSLGRMQIDAISRQIVGMTNVNAEEIRQLQIPIPDMDIQERIASIWQQGIFQRKQTLKKANALLRSIDAYLLAELGIQLPPEPENNLASRMFTTRRRELAGGRFDPKALHPEREACIVELQSKEAMKLRQVAFFCRDLRTEIPEGAIYIGLENVESNTGRYIPSSEKEGISSAFFFRKGQILFPKLRPYLNKVFLAPFDGLCSTEFHVLEGRTVSSEFLALFLRSRIVVKQTQHLMSGNTLPRLQTEDIEELLIPLVNHDVQKRIVSEAKRKAIEAENLRQQAEAELDQAKRRIEALLLGEENE